MSKTYFNISDKLRLYEFDGMLDQYGDAAAAYSLRKLRNGYTGDAVRVRRSSDNTERDMGFYDNELDTVALLDWVNADYVRYQSDFRASNPYTNYSANVTTSVGESIDGVDDAMKVTLTGGNAVHDICPLLNSTAFLGQQARFEFDYYIPSSNALANNFINFNTFSTITSSTSNLDILDTWTSVVIEGITTTAPGNIDTFIRARTGTSQTFNADGDVFYLKNIRVTQLTADGHVHTWYDQSANANHAVQGTATAQPKIVDAGSAILENGKPAIVDLDENKSLTSSLTDFASGNWNITQVVTPKSLDANTSIGAEGSNDLYIESNRIAVGFRMFWRSNLTLEESPSGNRTNQQFIGFHNNKNNLVQHYINSDLIISGTAVDGPRSTSHIFLFSSNTIQSGNVALQEAIFWQLDQSSNRTDIEFNINTYYNIY